MRDTIQKILLYLILVGTAAAWWQFGGAVLAISLGVIGLTALIFIAFTLGSLWTHKSMQTGANLVIQSTSKNDEHDAIKMRALAEVLNQALKFSHTQQQKLQTSHQYPPLPVIDANSQDDWLPMLPTRTRLTENFPIEGLVDDGQLGLETE